MAISVNNDVATTANPTSTASTSVSAVAGSIANVAANPHRVVVNIYMGLLALVMASFVVFVFYAKRHHLPYVYYGIFLMFWICVCGILYYVATMPHVVLG